MQHKRRVVVMFVVLASLAILIGPAGAQDAPQSPASAPCTAGVVYDPACDVDHDGDVDIFDIQLAAGHWNQAGPWSSGSWDLAGNAGTTPSTHFVGTTDLEALELHVAGQRALRLEPIPAPPDRTRVEGALTPNVIGGHADNTVTLTVQGAAIGGGGSAGSGHRILDDFGTIGGGWHNQAGDGAGTVSDRSHATVSGGADNWASGSGATVGGGVFNAAHATRATVAGGEYNLASAGWATVGGGYLNQATSSNATVAGGAGNVASENSAAVGGGSNNTASGNAAAVGGGADNLASGSGATVGGGANNLASGASATVPGGRDNRATGDFSLTAGRRAQADHAGAFVWADSTNVDFVSSADNQFLVRASGGVGINTNAPAAALAVDGGNSVARIAVNSNSPTANAGLSLRQDGANRWSIATVSTNGDLTFFREGAGGGSRLFVDGGGANAGYVGIGNAAPQHPLHMASGAHVTASGVWTNASSRQLKTGFAAVDQAALLDALAGLPIGTWRYRVEGPTVRHLGPTAEDFYAAFGLGSDDAVTIGTVDADGVALATIQALYQIIREQQRQLATQQQRIEALDARLATIEHQRSE